ISPPRRRLLLVLHPQNRPPAVHSRADTARPFTWHSASDPLQRSSGGLIARRGPRSRGPPAGASCCQGIRGGSSVGGEVGATGLGSRCLASSHPLPSFRHTRSLSCEREISLRCGRESSISRG